VFQLDPEDPKKVGVGVGGVEARKEPKKPKEDPGNKLQYNNIKFM
jgi:hypothetical protein